MKENRPFNTGIGEALAGTESSTSVQSHRLCINVRGTSQCTSISTLSDAANLSPSRSERLLGACQGRSRSSIRWAGRLRASSGPDSVATWEGGDGVLVTNIFVDNLTFITASRSSLGVHDCSQRRAVCDVPSSVGAVVDGVLEETDIGPSIREVTMEAKTGGVAIGPNPSPSAVVRELIDGDDHLVEDRHQMNGVGRRALSGVVGGGRVSHMRLVIGAVEVDTVPASGEEDLSAHAVGTIVREEIGTLGPVGITVMASAVVCRERP